MFEGLKRRISSLLGRVRSLTSYFAIGNSETYVHIDTEKAISEGYNGNTAVYSILNTDAEKFASIPMYVYGTGENKEPINNELSKLLNRPNNYQGQDSFLMLTRVYRQLTGEAFIWLNRGMLADGVEGEQRKKFPVLEMYVLPSDHVIIIPDQENVYGISGYKLDTGTGRLDIPKEDIIHWKGVSLQFDAVSRSHLRGQSPLSAGYKTLQQNNSATDAAVRMYQNDGAKGVLYNETHDALDQTQKQTVQDVVNRKINNNDIKSAVATLGGKWGYLDLGKSNTDLALLDGKDYSMKELCFLFGVPYELFDSETTFANKQQAQVGWVTNRVIPATKQFADELNRVLLISFGLEGKAIIGHDFSELPELQESLKQKIESMMKGPFKPNDVLELQGYDRDTNPLMEEVWMPQGYAPVSQSGQSMDSIANDLQNQGLL